MIQYRLSTKIKRLFFRPFYRRFDKVDERFKQVDERFKQMNEQMNWVRRELILNYYSGKKIDTEQQEVIDFLKANNFSVFSYSFPLKHDPKNIRVYSDNSKKLKYILHDNKPTYFPSGWSEDSVRGYYNGLLIEQDEQSPHIYETSNFYVHEGDVVADVGAAEGIFGLSIIDRAKKLYLFECEETWIEALEYTFAPYKDKVEIINKYVSDETKNDFITIDDFIGNHEINFIKADIEGAEVSLLKGASKTLLKSNNISIVLCTYHKQNDEYDLKQLLDKNGFTTEPSKGYMLFIYDKDLRAPYLRRGLIRGEKRGHIV